MLSNTTPEDAAPGAGVGGGWVVGDVMQPPMCGWLMERIAIIDRTIGTVEASNSITLFGLYGHERRLCLMYSLMFERNMNG